MTLSRFLILLLVLGAVVKACSVARSSGDRLAAKRATQRQQDARPPFEISPAAMRTQDSIARSLYRMSGERSPNLDAALRQAGQLRAHEDTARRALQQLGDELRQQEKARMEQLQRDLRNPASLPRPPASRP